MNSKIEKVITKDGSVGLYNKELNEVYHSIFGAKTEAFEKFIEPALILNNKRLKILDICYGIGYNTKCALENFSNIELIDCVEIDSSLVQTSFKYEYSDIINKTIEKNLKSPDFIYFYVDDVRKVVKKLNKKYDIIFHDGFAPHKQPQLWSENLIFEIVKLMHKDSLYLTYNHSKPVLNALKKTNLVIGKTIKNGKTIGTICSFNSDLIRNKLDDFELGQLNTKSAITYKDFNLDSTNEDIIEYRKNEIKNSNLISMTSYKKQKK